MEIQHFSHPDHKLTLLELESKEDDHESDDGPRRHSTRDFVKFESYTWDRAKDRAKDEADFHPAESDRITELQATQSMSKKNDASTSLDSKRMVNEELNSHPHHKLTLLQHEEDDSDIITELQAEESMSKKNGATTSLDSKCKDNEQLFSHPSHPDHNLTLLRHEESKEDESDDGSSEEKIKYCNGCNEVMCFPGYACHHESAKCKFYLHKSCAELPPKILHPLHPHPLTFLICDGWDPIICDGCRDLYRSGFIFNCSWCGFNLDAKCASKQDQEHHQTFKELTLFGFYHKHSLKLCNVRKSHNIKCLCCTLIISGSAYCCLQCQFFIHESCKEIPKEVEHPFHPQHILVFQNMDDYRNCAACLLSISTSSTSSPSIHRIGYCCDDCKFYIDDFCRMEISPQLQHPLHPHPLHLKHNSAHDGTTRMCRACRNPKVGSMLLSCGECNFDLHSACAEIMKQLSLKHECHNHNLYFAFDLIMKNEDSELLEDNVLYCNKCHDTGGYFYFCRECDINFHFECIPLPCDVKHICHRHPLTLTYSHIFEECGYFSFVHIECAISEDDTAVEVLKYLNPRPEKEQRSSTEDHHCSEKMETLESEASLDQKISYLDSATTSEDMNKVDADHDQERKEASDRLLSSLDESEKAEDETAEVQAKKIEEDHEDCDIIGLDKRIFENLKTKMEALSSETEVLVKFDQGPEVIRAKIQALVSELDDARKTILPITS
ncbi:hypothetical protein EZV62_007357 [Acer yangbiense]|uniref:DC1 domain-containing protein n=1 Tax=Acer yangbiense TaxID=1000413 RepID=A0A5C7IBL0_9ROSI|nr:hypothetical protein EZV62_007357 [Acer yangbiense]